MLSEDNDTVSEEQIAIISELSDIAAELERLFEGVDRGHEVMPQLINRLRKLGSRVGLEIAEGRVLSAQVILGQSRSIIVDLLQICGLSRKSAAAVLRPTSQHPAQPPEIWDMDIED